jgi:uncharacterized protein DUF5054
MVGSEVAGRVHVVFKTHLDVGFTNLARNVVERYFNEFIPAALHTATALRESGSSDRYVWTTGAWLIYEYLEQASPGERARMEAAISAGDITWHAMPFTMHCELTEPSLFRFGLRLSQILDERFGRKTIAAKMTDVPGHTRGIVPLLAEAGVEFLHIGVNAGSTVPDVPPVFVWRDTSGAEIVVMYNDTYGSTMQVAGIPDSISFAHTMDNLGPHDIAEVRRIFATIKAEFPGAHVAASTLDDFACALRPIRSSLPVVTSEIGDTWIHGVASDPRKVARFRVLSRLRAEWINSDRSAIEDPQLAEFSRKLLMVPEHTWGADDKTFLADSENYSQERFLSVVASRPFAFMVESWDEQRSYVDDAILCLGTSDFAFRANEALAAMEPRRPDCTGLTQVDVGNMDFSTDHFQISFDGDTGGIVSLTDNGTGEVLADADHSIGQFGYQTFSHMDYERFLGQYITGSHDWAMRDFGKPGLDLADTTSQWFRPKVAEAWHAKDTAGHTVVLRLLMPPEVPERRGGPAEVWLSVHLPASAPEIRFDLQWFDKPESRLPQACWFSFVPRARTGATWWMQKLGCLISPDDVVSNGNRRIHAVQDYLVRRDDLLSLRIDTLAAPVVALGEPSLLQFDNEAPRMERGVHFNLYNNVWGTNFPSWYGGDARFGFVLSLQSN